MNIKLVLTENHIKLLPFLYIKEDDDCVFISKNQLFSLGNHLLEDMAFILGKIDEAIPNSKDDSEGRAFPKELTDYMLSLYDYIKDNLCYIENLIHFYAFKGGLNAGTYVCKDNEMIWSKVDD